MLIRNNYSIDGYNKIIINAVVHVVRKIPLLGI